MTLKLNNITQEFIKLFPGSLLSVSTHRSNILTRAKNPNDADQLLLIFNSDFNFEDYISKISVNKLLSKTCRLRSPLIFTEAELVSSCDIFPIEFNEILETAYVLHGNNPSKYIKIENSNLRLQVESNLRRNLILIREEYLSRRKQSSTLLLESLGHFILSIKNLLRLKNIEVSNMDPRDIIVSLSEVLDVEVKVFFTLIRHFEDKQEKNKVDSKEWTDLFFEYSQQLTQIIQEVDLLEFKDA